MRYWANFTRSLTILLCLAVLTLLAAPKRASAQSEPILGQLMVFGGNFCPRGWTDTDGQLLAIAQYTALFSILGTTYGGDGRTTFGLPDLRGRSILGEGSGPGLATVSLGEKSGAQTKTLNVTEMPAHSHLVNATHLPADKGGPGDDYLAGGGNVDGRPRYHDGPPTRTMDPGMIANTGGSQAFDIRDPYLGLTICIALQGIYPSRN